MSLIMRIDEEGTVGTITLNAFKSKKADFVNFSSDYDGTFETDFSGKLTVVINVITTKFHIGQIKQQTELIEEEIKLFYPMLDYVQKYAKKTKATLTVPLSNFGVKEVRHAIHIGDVEKLNGALSTLNQNIDDNKTDLMAKGYKDADYSAFTDLKKKVFDDNVLQEGWKYDKQQAVENNMGLFLEVEEIIKDIQETGKILFKRSEPAVALEFTMADVLRKIRQEEPHTLICGVVKDSGNILASKVKVMAKKSDGTGRTKTDYTDTKGYYELRGMLPGAYDITFTMPGGKVFVLKSEAVMNEEVRLDAVEPV